MKVALVHDWLTGMRGGERCLHAFLQMYPTADLYTMLHIPGTTSALIDSRVTKTSFLQNIPKISKYYRHCLPLYPAAIRQFNLDQYDYVISLSHAAAKNVTIRNPRTHHLCYCFTPMRYIWDQAYHYFGSATPLLWPAIHWLRGWDRRGSESVEKYIAISKFVAARIKCFYGRSADVVHPPVDLSWLAPARVQENGSFKKGEAFLYAGALVPYKRPELVIEAFNQIKEPLWVVGSGPEERRLKDMAGPHIQFFGKVSDADLASIYAHCRALIFPGVEDFGMVPIECMGAGRPIIGLYAGGLKETLRGIKPWDRKQSKALETRGATGVFFPAITADPVSSVISAVYYFMDREETFSSGACIAQAELFSAQGFRQTWSQRIISEGKVKVQEPRNARNHSALI